MTDSLREPEIEFVKMVAREAAREILENYRAEIKEQIDIHERTCRYGETMRGAKRFIAGMAVGAGMIGGGTGAAIIAVVRRLFVE